jgi:hypothetical protein
VSPVEELQLLERRDKVFGEWSGVWRILDDLFPSYGRRTGRRDEEVLRGCRRAEERSVWTILG